ncbi:LysR family transcriptional regulator [Tistrella sp.]|uniref:LysR family transcriptional regulator n=1 Tax=Tistrella sp. TaxID=2024861 RepID=UPI000C935CA6|nr:LysR family transcriptional regulator [Tistrella sp.]MAD37134.1 LysR family transcriptional regulator [Tistrella sp.]
MLVRHLSYFVTLAGEKHFARAAARCNITQPTLSAAIRKLEQDLEVRLVVRGHRFTGLTAEGEKLLVWARQILRDYDSLREDLDGGSGLTGTLRLGVIPAAMPSVAFLSARFMAAHPAARIAIQSLTSRAIQRGLDAFELDGGLTYLENEPPEHVRLLPLYQERYVFVTGPDHPFAGRDRLGWAEAFTQTLCLLSEDMQNRRILNKVASGLGVTVDAPVVSNSFLGACAHIRQGGWSSIVPHTFLHVLGATPDLVSIDLVDPVHTQSVGLVLSDRDPPSPMAAALLTCLRGADFERDFARENARVDRGR